MHDFAVLSFLGVLPVDMHAFSAGHHASEHHFFPIHQARPKEEVIIPSIAPRMLTLPDDYPPQPPR